jgi:7,8-dihydropterin-6-yl-methyl-4-(beta-D-ribofuranosyl)aminobenzene 5'-phosphate synthase
LPLQEVPTVAVLRGAGYIVVESTRQESILDSTFVLSGEVPRRSFERGLTNHLRRTSTGGWEADPLVLDERFMVAHIEGKGLAIFTGCSHAGIVNICEHAQEMFPGTPLYALVGGFHLVHPNEDLIDETIAALRPLDFKVIIPGHCTGWRAVHAFINAFGDASVDPMAVGSRQTL